MIAPAVLPREAAAAYVGISVSTFEALIRRSEAPAPRKLSAGRVGWLRRELDEWAESRPVSDIPPGPGGAS